ncbi:hypothetical protein IFR05_009603 [Cadophora sp. M221]|nr:hypothetical protein IFR05_009603 [Cadophora sp. M221]
MAPQSNSSSLGAQNGSAYRLGTLILDIVSIPHPNQSSSSYPASTANSRNPPQRQLSDPSAVGYNRRDRNAAASDSTNAHHDRASVEEYTGDQTSSQGHSTGHHYLPVYDRETPRYENELTLDDDQNTETTVPETPSDGRYTQQAPAHNQYHHNNNQPDQPNGVHPPTTERWSSEHTPEERLRLGLSRYPTEEERRLAYEDAVDYESRRSD